MVNTGGHVVAKRPRQEQADGACQAQEPSQKSTALSEKLLNAILSISRCATLEDALLPLLDAALDLTGMDGGGVYWVEDRVAVLRHHRGLPEAFIREVVRVPLAPPPVQTLLGLREPVEIAEISPKMRALFRRHGIRHAFSFPLRARKTLFGFLNVGSTRPEAPAKADIQALHLLVGQMEALFWRLYSERALRESEERYRVLLQSALDGIVLHELPSLPREGRIIDVNDCACRMLGYSREELQQRSPWDLVDDEWRKAVPELVAKVGRTGRLLFEMVLVAKDGRRIPVEINTNLIELKGQEVALSVIRDVTERRRAAAALHESEERFRTFMGNSPAVAWMKDEQGRYVYLNQAYERCFGVRLEDRRGKTDVELWPPETAREFHENDLAVLRENRPLEVIERTPSADGKWRYWWSVKFPFQDAAGAKYVGGIGLDITDRKHAEEALQQSEERYRMLAETARDFIFVLDREERVQYVNQYGAAAMGYRPEEMIGRRTSELFEPELAARHSRSLRRVIESGEALSVVAPSRFHERELWLTTQLTPIHGPAGEIQGVLGIARDITEQKQLEEELRRLNEHLEQQVAQRTAELTQRAHQLQRLTAELSQAEERERERLAEFLHDDLQQVLAGAKFHLSLLNSRARGDERLLEIVEQVRRMLKEAIEKSRSLSHELGPPALYHGSLEDTFEWLAHQMGRKQGLIVHLEMHGRIGSSSEPVRSLVYRAAQEILFNIVKHAGVRDARLRLQRVRDELWLTISDKGRGFEPASLAQTAGFGLLSIRERVELLGGRMRIKSAPGKGSTFLIILPEAGVPSQVDLISAPTDT